jgi:uncharacterized protein YdhG (YjbR/CyaY superfamily)
MKTYKTISEYLNSLSEESGVKAREIYRVLKKLLPKAEEAIRYGMPTFRLNGQNLLHFAVMKNHLGFYPAPSAIKKFEKEIAKKFKYSKGAIQFPLEEKLPLALIKKIAQFRLKESIRKK